MAAVVAEKGQTMRLEVAVAAACIGPRLCHCRLWQRRSLPLLALAAPHRQRPVRTVTLAARVLSVRLSLRRAAEVVDAYRRWRWEVAQVYLPEVGEELTLVRWIGHSAGEG